MKKKKASTSVESLRHNDKRKNIPTEELRDFVADDEKHPKTILYPSSALTKTDPLVLRKTDP